MHSLRTVFFAIAVSVIFFGTSLRGSAAASTTAAPTGTISMSWATAGAEQNLGARLIAVNRRGGSFGAASVHCNTVNGTAVAGKDFTAVSSEITWASGDSWDKSCNVTISNATPFTGQKTFYVQLSGATGAPLGTTPRTVVTIYGDKGGGLVSLSAPTYTAVESAGSVTISVNRTSGSSGGASVNYATANSTAIAGTNYTSERGTLSWGNGDSAPKSFVIPISKTPFTGTKTLAVAIAGSEGAALGATTSAMVTITGGAATSTGTATLSWTAPTLDTNGSPITDLAGYNIHYGTSPTTMTHVVAVNNPASGSYTISNLAAGTWYFAVVAYNAQAVESSFSNVVNKTM
jgi:Calx-beta domain